MECRAADIALDSDLVLLAGVSFIQDRSPFTKIVDGY